VYRDLPDGNDDSDVAVHHADRVYTAAASRRTFTSTMRAELDAADLLPHGTGTWDPTSGRQAVSTEECRSQPVLASAVRQLRQCRQQVDIAR